MNPNRVSFGALCAALLLPLLVHAEALIKPLPVPDLSKLPPAQAKQLAADRANFDKAHAELVGPPLAQAYADMGALYLRAGFKDVAAVAFYDASQTDPRDGRWLYLRGVIARDMKKDAEARENFQEALKIDRIYLPIQYRLSDTLVDLGDVEAARQLLEKTCSEHPDQAVGFAMLGQLYLKQKRYTQAVENLQSALKLEPQANQLYKPLAEAYTAIGNTQAAKDAESKAGDVVPRLGDPLVLGLYGGGGPQVSGTPLQQAQQLAASGRIGLAREKLGAALHDHPDDVDALALQARIEASVGNQLIAAAAADQALKVAPDSATALLARGIVHEYGAADDQAYAFYQRAVRADPKQATARLLLGNAEMRRARYGAAADQYRQLVALQPTDAQAQAHLVAADVAAGQCARALSDVSAAQGRDAKNGNLMQLFVRLASTCPAANKNERDMALDYAKDLYKQQPDADDSSALALALAAHGQFKDAQQYQAEAIFEAIRVGDKADADLYRSTQAMFAANKVPDRPWPSEHDYFKPPMLAPVRPPAAAPAPAPAKQ
jgi:tetratricopeptide (TPR) repeat protein